MRPEISCSPTVQQSSILMSCTGTPHMNFMWISVCCLLFGGPGSVVGIATGYRLDDPGIESRWGARFSAPVQTGPGAHPASCTVGTGSFPGVKSGRGVTLTPHPLLVPWSRKGRAIPLLPLRAVRPVQSLSACTRVHFTMKITTTKYADQRSLGILWMTNKCSERKFHYNTEDNNLKLWML